VKARLRAIGAFWYDFVIGDDWRGAAVVAAALAVTAILAHGISDTFAIVVVFLQ